MFALLAVLLAATSMGIWLTGGGEPKSLPLMRKAQHAPKAQELVDQSPLQAAQRLSGGAASEEELQLAAEARRVADLEVDLAFEQALREAAEQQASLSGDALALRKELEARQQRLSADDEKLAKLKTQAGANPSDAQQKQIALAEAERALDEDQVDDARQDLARAGGDPRARIQQLLDQHKAAQHSDEEVPTASAGADTGGSSLVSQFALWRKVSGFRDQLIAAQQQALVRAQALAMAHDALEQETKEERAANARKPHGGKKPTQAPAQPDTAPSLELLNHLAGDQKNLASYDKRIRSAQALAETYGKWAALVEGRQLAALRRVLISFAIILAIALAAVALHWLIDRSLRSRTHDRRYAHTFRSMLRLAVQVVCVLAVLMVIFGAPTQLGTMLGLLGAGLTFVLRDFILSFLGWFVLMGRNGIRVGDWVEIEGVRGEVVEIGLLRTVLLETGNWTDQGRPTGRKVSFANTFAMQQHYFNFSTASQWLWDELEVVIPPSHDPYPLVEAIRETVATETAENQRLAAEEWQRVRRGGAGSPVSTSAHVSLRPIPEGVDVKVRYVARASERYDFRSRLYSKILDLLRKARAEHASAGTRGA